MEQTVEFTDRSNSQNYGMKLHKANNPQVSVKTRHSHIGDSDLEFGQRVLDYPFANTLQASFLKPLKPVQMHSPNQQAAKK